MLYCVFCCQLLITITDKLVVSVSLLLFLLSVVFLYCHVWLL